MAGILDGIRIIEWGYYHVGPYPGAMMADLGAEVIKVEDVSGGDPMRYFSVGHSSGGPKQAKGWSYSFEVNNRSKKAIAVNLKQEAGREIVYRLVKTADVFLSSMRRPAALSLGMDRATLLKHNPKLIYAHATGFGDKGEEATSPAFDGAGQARAGIMMALAGVTADAEPLIRHSIGDQMGGVSTAYGILAALLARERLGITQEVDTSIMGGVLWAMSLHYHGVMSTGEEEPVSTRKKSGPFNNPYQTKDGKWLLITGAPDAIWWQRLCQILGLEELIQDPRYREASGRREHAEELVRILDGVFAQKDRDEWLKIFKEKDFPAAPVLTPLEAVNDPQALANGYVVDYDHPFLGPVKVPGSPADFSDTPPQVCRPAPTYGEHTTPVLLELGYSLAEIEALRSQNTIK